MYPKFRMSLSFLPRKLRLIIFYCKKIERSRGFRNAPQNELHFLG